MFFFRFSTLTFLSPYPFYIHFITTHVFIYDLSIYLFILVVQPQLSLC